jgi:signal peptidase I
VRIGDVIVFRRPPKDDSPPVKELVKRVLTTGGETIYVANGNVYINGNVEPQRWLPSANRSPVDGRRVISSASALRMLREELAEGIERNQRMGLHDREVGDVAEQLESLDFRGNV